MIFDSVCNIFLLDTVFECYLGKFVFDCDTIRASSLSLEFLHFMSEGPKRRVKPGSQGQTMLAGNRNGHKVSNSQIVFCSA